MNADELMRIGATAVSRAVRDPARVAAVRALGLRAAPGDAAFDRLTRLAARLLEAPVALVNLVDVDRQVTKSAFGDPEQFRAGDETPLADSFCRFPVTTGEPLVVTDAREVAPLRDAACVVNGSVIAYAGVPLSLASGAVLGTLCVVDVEPRAWTDEDVETLRDLAASAVTELELRAAVAAAEGRSAVEANARRLEAVQRVTDAALAEQSLADLLPELLARVREILHADTATILLLSESEHALRVCASIGLEEEAEQGFTIPFGQGIAGRIAADRQPVIVHDVGRVDVVSPLLLERVRSLIGAPLVVDGRVIGVIHVGSRTPREFEEDDLRLLQLAAGRAANAIERSRLFDAEREARQAAETASRAKSDFLAVMSHELRTPLNAIGGYAELLASGVRGPVPDPQLEDLRRIKRNQEHLLRLINNILLFAQLERGSARSRAEPVRLDEALLDMDAEMQACAAKGVVYARERCPSLVALAERARLREALHQLASNALKFTPAGGRVEVRCIAEERDVVVEIRDTGSGIPPERLESIFEPFAQSGGSSYTRTHEGLGLGLALSRALVRSMGGDLDAESRPGEGAVFRVRLRCAVAP